MEKIKFVMTDTDTQVSAVCRRALEAKGIAVTVCEKNGTKALETLLAVHPQAVLLDAFMPDLDAITVKQRYEAQNTSSTHIDAGTAPKSKRQASHRPKGVLSTKPQPLISALMRRGDRLAVSDLPMTA